MQGFPDEGWGKVALWGKVAPTPPYPLIFFKKNHEILIVQLLNIMSSQADIVWEEQTFKVMKVWLTCSVTV